MDGVGAGTGVVGFGGETAGTAGRSCGTGIVDGSNGLWTAGSGTGILVIEDNRGDKPGPMTNNYVHDNVVIENAGPDASGWWACGGCD